MGKAILSSTPNTLRAIGLATLIVAVLFHMQHWPGATLLLIAAWLITLAALLVRVSAGGVREPDAHARDLFTFGLVSYLVTALLHLPGSMLAFIVLVIGGVGVLWNSRARLLPSKDDPNSLPWLFYGAFLLIICGTVFRIQHWPYSTTLLIVGLAVSGYWFFTSMNASR